MTEPEPLPLALSAGEVARLLSCSERHVYRLIENGELPIVPHMGARKVVPRIAVERLIEQAMGGENANTPGP